jgi:TetR/AcrR family transcriptional regulator, regulator of cefoperazone and chloramphenicol sensitivity
MASVAKHRHVVNGGYQRGEETRARIIGAAIKLFGERGFESASTRDIAAAAGVNTPALQYYFDNKEGVYLACAEYIAARVWEHISEPVERAQQLLEQHADDSALIDAYCAIQARGADFKFTDSVDHEQWRTFLVREQASLNSTPAFSIVYRRLTERVYGVTTAIVGQLLGRAADDEETLIRTMALSGQFLMFYLCRRTAMMLLGWDAMHTERVDTVTRVICQQTGELLRSMAAARDAAAVSSGRTSVGDPGRLNHGSEAIASHPRAVSRRRDVPSRRKRAG